MAGNCIMGSKIKNKDNTLEICVKCDGVAVPTQAVHDSCLLVVAHTLLKEVGLTPAHCEFVDTPVVQSASRVRGWDRFCFWSKFRSLYCCTTSQMFAQDMLNSAARHNSKQVQRNSISSCQDLREDCQYFVQLQPLWSMDSLATCSFQNDSYIARLM